MRLICPNCKKELTELKLILQEVYVIFYEKEAKIDLGEENVGSEIAGNYVYKRDQNWKKSGGEEPSDIILEVRCPYCYELLGEFDPELTIEELKKELEEKI